MNKDEPEYTANTWIDRWAAGQTGAEATAIYVGGGSRASAVAEFGELARERDSAGQAGAEAGRGEKWRKGRPVKVFKASGDRKPGDIRAAGWRVSY